MNINDIICCIVGALDIFCLIMAIRAFYRHRHTEYKKTYGRLLRQIHIPDGEEADIQCPEPGEKVVSGKHHKPFVYFEYAYIVDGKEYYKDYHIEEEEMEEYPKSSGVVIYNSKNPKDAYMPDYESMPKNRFVGILYTIFAVLLSVVIIVYVIGR